MVRNIVGTLVAAGLDELAVSELPELIASGDRERAPRALDPKGLFLVDVKYA